MSYREIVTVLHGMACGGLLLLAFSGALVWLCRLCTPEKSSTPSVCQWKWLRGYLVAMAVLAWGAVLSGAYFVYPWYRARAPEGTTDLAQYPQRLLLASPATAGWHNLGMEWKEHVAWFAPIAITMAAWVVIKYGAELGRNRQIRRTVFAFMLAAFLAAGIAGALGALINKNAPVRGGEVIKINGVTE